MDFADVPDDQRNIDLAGRFRGPSGTEKWRNVDDAGNVDSLPLENQGGQGAVETSGKKA
jgi:hypothetical protein